MTKPETVTAEDIDHMAYEGQDMTTYIKMDTLRIPNLEEDINKTSDITLNIESKAECL